MPEGASWRFNDGIDQGNLIDSHINSLDVGGNVYRHPTLSGLNVLVSPLEYVDDAGTPKSFPGQTTALALAASATTFLWVDTGSNTLQTSTSSFPASTTPHIRLAEVVTNATEVTTITDRRPRVTQPASPTAVPDPKRDAVSITSVGQTSFPGALSLQPLTPLSDHVHLVLNGIVYDDEGPSGDFELTGGTNQDLTWNDPGGLQLDPADDLKVVYFA